MAKSTAHDWSAIPVEKLDILDPPEASGFRPLRGEFATYWKQGRVARDLRSHLSNCWFVRNNENLLAGYVTLLADCLAMERPLLEGENVRYRTFPAVKIGLLAVDKRAKGLGTALMHWAFRYTASELCPRLGARFVKVDALYDPDSDYDTSEFYTRFGFTFADGEGQRIKGQPFRTMYFDLKPILDALGGKLGIQ